MMPTVMPSRADGTAPLTSWPSLASGFWPVIAPQVARRGVQRLGCSWRIASPMPMLTTIFSSFGACIPCRCSSARRPAPGQSLPQVAGFRRGITRSACGAPFYSLKREVPSKGQRIRTVCRWRSLFPAIAAPQSSDPLAGTASRSGPATRQAASGCRCVWARPTPGPPAPRSKCGWRPRSRRCLLDWRPAPALLQVLLHHVDVRYLDVLHVRHHLANGATLALVLARRSPQQRPPRLILSLSSLVFV